MRWRTGRKVGRTIYAQAGPLPSKRDVLIGVMDTPELARAAVDAYNATLPPAEQAPDPDSTPLADVVAKAMGI